MPERQVESRQTVAGVDMLLQVFWASNRWQVGRLFCCLDDARVDLRALDAPWLDMAPQLMLTGERSGEG